jgi:hypothetical protein
MVCAAMDSTLNRQREMGGGRSGFGASLTCHEISRETEPGRGWKYRGMIQNIIPRRHVEKFPSRSFEPTLVSPPPRKPLRIQET